MNWLSGDPGPNFVAVRESVATQEIVHVFSDVDIACARAFGSILSEAFVLGKRTIVDLTECPYMDSTGLRLLIGAHNALGDRLEIWVSPASMVARVLAVSGIDRVLAVVVQPAPGARSALRDANHATRRRRASFRVSEYTATS